LLDIYKEGGGCHGVAHIVVGGVAMPENGFPRLVIPDGVGEGRAGRRILAVQVANAELAGPLLVFVENEQCGVAAVCRGRQCLFNPSWAKKCVLTLGIFRNLSHAVFVPVTMCAPPDVGSYSNVSVGRW